MWCRLPNLCRTTRQIASRISILPNPHIISHRAFHSSIASYIVKPFLLADIGEGIRECEVIQWFVEPGARVEQFDKLCEVQSDKASVEITSRYDGVVKKLYYDAGDMAIVGKPLVDIDMQAEEEAPNVISSTSDKDNKASLIPPSLILPVEKSAQFRESVYNSLATPAVRRLCKEYEINISEVPGTGKDGRVLKEDITNFLERRRSSVATATTAAAEKDSTIPALIPSFSIEERIVPLTPIQSQMLKRMTTSLSIPHFLFTDEIKLDSLIRIRTQINSKLTKLDQLSEAVSKLTYMPFFIKAMSLALQRYPIMNSRLQMDCDKPMLIMRPQHNIGVAMDTPAGLVVPNIKNVQGLSILQIAQELLRLQKVGMAGKLSPIDLRGGTITISNIGNIGGTVLSPVVVDTEVAILGIGKAKKVPMYDHRDEIVPTTIINFSWSADHRVIDGATMARMATMVKELLEEPEFMLATMK